MKTSDILNKAADLIEERGWGRGNEAMRMDGRSPICLEGAIAAAIGIPASVDYDGALVVDHMDVAVCPAYAAVKAYLGNRCRNATLEEDDSDLWAWNDTVARNATEVIEVLRAAAVIEAARESEDPETFACPTCNLLVIDTDPSSDVFEVTVARHQDGACVGAGVRA